MLDLSQPSLKNFNSRAVEKYTAFDLCVLFSQPSYINSYYSAVYIYRYRKMRESVRTAEFIVNAAYLDSNTLLFYRMCGFNKLMWACGENMSCIETRSFRVC